MQDTVSSMAASTNECASPIPSSVDSFDLEQEEETTVGYSDLRQNYRHYQQTASPTIQQQQSVHNAISQQPQLNITPQKRRRVTRACDECRRKKIKCDGKQPCTHCTVYNYDCTYDQPSNRRRNPTPQYIEALENRLRRAEALLNAAFPNLDPNDPGIDKLIQLQDPVNKIESPQILSKKPSDRLSSAKETNLKLRSMVQATGELDLDEHGNRTYYGESSGVVFLRRLQKNFDEPLVDRKAPFFPHISKICKTQDHESSRSSQGSSCDSRSFKSKELPPRDTTETLCEIALCQGCTLLQFIHLPTFYEKLQRVYELPYEEFEETDHSFLALLFVTLALGHLFNDNLGRDPNKLEKSHTKSITDKSLKYFQKAQSMINIMDCRNLIHLQAIVFMILLFQYSADLSTCYSYIGIAQRAALQMGLHRKMPDKFNPVERETRRRVFWTIRKLDICISAMLGFPELLSSEDIDQEMPIEVEDKFITKTGVILNPEGKPSLLTQAANAYTKLMFTLAKVLKYIYPTKGLEESIGGEKMTGCLISHEKILEIEQDLAHWLESLPPRLRPGGEEEVEIIRAQQLLRLFYAHVQMMLYRPFLLHVSKKPSIEKNSCKESLACAVACINVSRNIVHITNEMKDRGLLVGAYCSIISTTYFAILSLVYFVIRNTDASGSPDILRDASSGKDALSVLAQNIQLAQRYSTALTNIFEKLPDKLKNSSNSSAIARNFFSETSLASGTDISHSMEPSRYQGSGIESILKAKMPSIPQERVNQDCLLTSPVPITKLKHNSHEPSSPANSHKIKTPISNRPSNAIHQPTYSSQQLEFNQNFHNLNSGLFSSTDNFVFQSQPSIDFENIKHGSDKIMIGNSQQSMFMSNDPQNRDRIQEEIGGQLIRALPTFLTPGLSSLNTQSSMGTGNLMTGALGQNLNFHGDISHLELPNNIDLFPVDGELWNNIVDDQRYAR